MPPRIESLKVRNYRALRDVEFGNLTPTTVLLGPNGSGKSTVFDVFAFLAECFSTGLRSAWDRRGRAREIRTRDAQGPVVIELKYREEPKIPLVTYHLAVDERAGAPAVVHEWLQWKRGRRGRPFRFLEYGGGAGRAASGAEPDANAERLEIPLKSPDLLAVNALGQFQDHPRVAALRDFIMGWHVSCLAADGARGQPEAGPQERLTATGGNLANVIQHLGERHPARLEEIFEALRQRVPRIERVLAEAMPDGRLLLQVKDAPFSHPVLARFASDGTLKMLAYLVLLHDPEPPPFIGIEEPENFLHPRLLSGLARNAARPARAPNCSSPPIRRSFSTGSGPRRCAFCGATRPATPRRGGSPTWNPCGRSWMKARFSAICGWKAISASATRSPATAPRCDDGGAPSRVPGRGAVDGGFSERAASAPSSRRLRVRHSSVPGQASPVAEIGGPPARLPEMGARRLPRRRAGGSRRRRLPRSQGEARRSGGPVGFARPFADRRRSVAGRQPNRDRGAGGVVFRGLGNGARCLSEGSVGHPRTSSSPRPRFRDALADATA